MNPPVTFISGDRRLPELVGDVIAMFVPVLSLLCCRRSIIESVGDADHRQTQRPACRPAVESPEVTAVSVDSAWLKHCAPPKQKFMGRQVNIVGGRATRADGTSQVVAYVGKRVASLPFHVALFS